MQMFVPIVMYMYGIFIVVIKVCKYNLQILNMVLHAGFTNYTSLQSFMSDIVQLLSYVCSKSKKKMEERYLDCSYE